MNNRKVLYIVALLLSLMFIFYVAFCQEPIKEQNYTEKFYDSSSVKTKDNTQSIITIHQEESQQLKKQQNKSLNYKEYSIPSNRGFKSYMSYRAITSKSSKQYKLQNQYAYTGKYGIRQVDGRFCIAIGTFSNAKIGSYIDLILENGTVIPCIVSDFKANVHTDSTNKITSHNGCVSEFIVDMNNLNVTAKKMGDISYCKKKWNSPVKKMKIYKKNVFD